MFIITEKYICTLSPTTKSCEYRNKDGTCLKSEKGCGFREEDKKTNEPHTKQKKWYEEYVRK